jgi:hypothetical protein
VASSPSTAEAARKNALSPGPSIYVGIAIALALAAAYFYLNGKSARAPDSVLTEEGKAYTRNLKLSDVTMKATDSYVGQRIIEIEGKIANAGDRALESVEIYCVFYDAYGQLVLRKRVPIVSQRMGGLKPGDTKSFRLPFDEISPNWNEKMPQLVIASVTFS